MFTIGFKWMEMTSRIVHSNRTNIVHKLNTIEFVALVESRGKQVDFIDILHERI